MELEWIFTGEMGYNRRATAEMWFIELLQKLLLREEYPSLLKPKWGRA